MPLSAPLNGQASIKGGIMQTELVKEMIMRANVVQDQSAREWFFHAQDTMVDPYGLNPITEMAYNFEKCFYTLVMIVHSLLDFVLSLILTFLFNLDIPGVVFVSISFILVLGLYLVTKGNSHEKN
jgi:hypothetical protein